jgi:integrase
MTTSNSDKQNYVNRYASLCKANNIIWKRPYYKSTTTQPKIPTREAIMKIITESRSNAPAYKTLMETGLMPYELSQVEQKNIDFEKRIIYAKGFKGHLARTFKLTEETTAMLNTYFTKHTKFPTSKALTHSWIRAKNRVAERLQEPSIKTIRLYDLRHYYATNLYAKTDKILLVKQQLGHKKIETTMIYTQLVNFTEDEDYICTATKDTAEAKQLIEHGFQYVNTTPDGIMLYRKRK